MAARGEELFDLLDRLLREDPQIDELAFVPDCDELRFDGERPAPTQRLHLKSETKTAILLRGHKVALAFWALPPIYKHASGLLNALRRKARRLRSLWSEPGPARDALRYSRAVLIVSADNYSAWNARKQLIRAGRHKTWDEFAFVDLILTKHPKSGETWAHRGWLYRQLQAAEQHASATLNRELRACARYADTYARNYYAWTHRLLLLPSVVSLARSAEELDVLYRWSRTHVSDASALHYRAQLLLAMSVHESGTAKIADEISKLTELIEFYEGHEALFCYLRFLLIFSPSAALAPLMRRLCAQGGKQRRLALNVLAWLMLFKPDAVASLSLDATVAAEAQALRGERGK